MPQPTSITDFGTILPSATLDRTGTSHGRFKDVKTYANCAMPTVKIGQVYKDLDPRSAGRNVQVLKVRGDGKVMVRTVAPRTGPPRTPSTQTRDTTGDISFISLRRFRENSRGFRLLHGSTIRSVNAYFLAARLADACKIPVTEVETRACDALIGLLGNFMAHDYLDAISDEDGDIAHYIYREQGLAYLLADALKYAEEADEYKRWQEHEIASKATARTVARHC